MIKLTPLLAGVFLLGALAKAGGCQIQTVTGSGVLETTTHEVAPFDAIRVGHTFAATSSQGDTPSVVVTADDNLAEHIEVEVTDTTLRVGFAGPINLRNTTLQVAITLPTLTDLRVSGASEADLQGIVADGRFFLQASGASEITGDLTAEALRVSLSGASELSITGSADSLDLDMSGASSANLSYYPVTNAKASLSGASDANVDVSGTLGPVKASGASSLTYYGNPETKDIHTSGASSVSGG